MNPADTPSSGRRPARPTNTVIVVACSVFVAAMVGAAFAAVPLYSLFCRVTGFAGTPLVAQAAPVEVGDRDILVRFDANVSAGLPWRFRPVDRSVTVRLGAVTRIAYEIENRSSQVTWGTAAFNVAPSVSGAYFSKINCFCFTAQKLEPHETREIFVVFYVDPAIAEDDSTDGISSITLSYTFFPKEPPAEPAPPAKAAGGVDAALADDGQIADTVEQRSRNRMPDGSSAFGEGGSGPPPGKRARTKG